MPHRMEYRIELRYLRTWRALGILFILIALAASLIPVDLRSNISQSDKLYHVVTYSWLMFWFAQLYRKGQHPWLGLGLIGFGIVVEALQSLTSYRSAEFLDVIANTTGVLGGWVLSRTPLGGLLRAIEQRLGRVGELLDK
jgi:VanZ family protein